MDFTTGNSSGPEEKACGWLGLTLRPAFVGDKLRVRMNVTPPLRKLEKQLRILATEVSGWKSGRQVSPQN